MQETPDLTNGAEAPASSPEGAQGDLAQRLKEAEQAAQQHQEAWLRARADCDNIRKRSQTEIANAHKFAVEKFAEELLPVTDSLEAALASESASVESMPTTNGMTIGIIDGRIISRCAAWVTRSTDRA